MDTTYRAIAIKVENLWVVKGGSLFSNRKAILQDVSFDVQPGTFVGVVGPNGAGKTTMLKVLIGDKPYSGRILFSQDSGPNPQYEDLYDNPEYWLQQIGYVPVDNVLQDELTVRQALMHIGRLRLPGTSDSDLETRVTEKLKILGFDPRGGRLDQFVKTLSSGERKKVNIAAELLTDPPLLLLDEPTSNLDPNAERQLMDNLRQLSGCHNNGNGPTVVLITHTLESIDRCDQVVFIANSRLDPGDHGTPDEVFQIMEGKVRAKRLAEGKYMPDSPNPFEHWAIIFDENETDEAIARRETVPLPKPKLYPRAPRRSLREDSFWRQFKILSSRYFLTRYNDLGGIFTILFSAFVAGFLLLIAPSKVFLKASDASAARQTIVLFVILVVITGAFNSHREISKEFRIYIHERTKGLNPLAYLASKVVWLSVVLGLSVCLIMLALVGMPLARVAVVIFGALLLVIGIAFLVGNRVELKKLTRSQIAWRLVQMVIIVLPLFLAAIIQLQNKELPDSPISSTNVELSIIVTLSLTCIAALVAGILVSSLVSGNNDRATQLVIAVIIANVILAFSVLVIGSPQFRAFFEALEPFTATHWGYGGFSSSLNIYCWAGSLRFDEFNSAGHLLVTWIYLLTHVVVATGLAVLALRMQETWLSRQRVLQSLVRSRWTWAYALVVVLMLSWCAFLSQQSRTYYTLTFFDELYGGNRYADIGQIPNATFIQQLNGEISQSACVLPDTSQEASMPVQMAVLRGTGE